jgi:hypothetical protein
MSRNLYWDTASGADLDFAGMDFAAWQADNSDRVKTPD